MGQTESSPTYMVSADKTTLKILLVTDTHANGYQMNQFALWQAKYNPQYDFVIHSGDFSNIGTKEHSDPIKEKEAEQHATDTLKFFTERVKAPLLFIPGNHEANKMYSDGISVPNAINMYKKSFLIDDHLVLVGMGGSIPAVKEENKKWVEVWEGYPYKSDEEYKKDLDETFEGAFKKFGSDSDYILLTHVGPWDSITSISHMSGSTIYAGSQAQMALHAKYTKNILCSIHGHTHDSEGMAKLHESESRVLNTGAMTIGRFGELNLAKGANGRWRVTSFKYYNMGE